MLGIEVRRSGPMVITGSKKEPPITFLPRNCLLIPELFAKGETFFDRFDYYCSHRVFSDVGRLKPFIARGLLNMV
jgi:hypothetical protein